MKMKRVRLRASIYEPQTMSLAFVKLKRRRLTELSVVDLPVLQACLVRSHRSEGHWYAQVRFGGFRRVRESEVIEASVVRIGPDWLARATCILDSASQPTPPIMLIDSAQQPYPPRIHLHNCVDALPNS